MTKLLYSATTSLDGFIAGPGGDMQWSAETSSRANPEAAALMEDMKRSSWERTRTAAQWFDPSRLTVW